MPIQANQERQAWIKTPAPPKKKPAPRYLNRAEQKEAICSRLRYFACQPLDSPDRIRMLNRPVKGGDGMIDIDRAPSPVPDQWTGAGLKFQNGARGGSGATDRRKLRRDRERGFDMESEDDNGINRGHRVVSEPARAPRARSMSRSRTRTIIDEDDLIEVIEEPSLLDEDIRSLRSYRSQNPRLHRNERDEIHSSRPLQRDARSQRSASPSPPQAESVYSRRQREPTTPPRPTAATANSNFNHRPQARNVTAPGSSRPIPRSTPLNSSYQFQSAIFQQKESANHYRSVYEKRNKDGTVGPASWASATSALSFD